MRKTTTLSPADFKKAIAELCQDSESELRRTVTRFQNRRSFEAA